jgi:hypothetical protein
MLRHQLRTHNHCCFSKVLISHFCCPQYHQEKLVATAVFDALLTYEFLGYWGGIAVGMNFIGFTMLDCFSKIHEDIIGAWNLGDTDSVRHI